MRQAGSVVFFFSVLVAISAAQTGSVTAYTPGLDPASLDRSADPCVDFYQFACGGWMKNNPIPADQTRWSVATKLEDENRVLLRQILENAAKPQAHRTPNDQKIGDYYGACMDEEAVEKAGIEPLKPDLERIKKIRNIREIAEYLASFHPRDVYTVLPSSTLFSFTADQDYKNSAQYLPEADQGGLGLPDREYYLKGDDKSKKLRQEYLEHMQKMFVLLGDKPLAAAENATAVLDLETALAKGSMSRVERRDPAALYHKMSRAELQALTPDFNWKIYLAGVGLPDAQTFNVVAPGFFKVLQTELDTEPLESWKSYLRWHLVHANARYLSEAFVDENFSFYGAILTGQQEDQPRWKRCVRFADRDLGEALSQAYVAKVFTPEDKQRAHEMVEQIEAAMQRDIEQLPWMSDATKKAALEKLHLIRNKIGYPDHWRDYSAVEITPQDFLGNVQRSVSFEFHRQLGKIGKPVDRGEWLITPVTVDAYYNPQTNDINFPAAMLQPPFFDPKMDDAVNFGDIGGVIGHELTHAFDDEGRQFDGEGNLRDWWTDADAKEFEKRAACVSTQYSGYTVVDNVKINGKLTLGEDVADLGGLILAYMAWQTEAGKPAEPLLDGFTPEQQFFIGYGQGWCTNETEQQLRMNALTNPHSPAKYRANGVVSNMPEFGRAFHCMDDQPMVRQNPCRVW